MKTFSEVTEWMRGAAAQFVDPAAPVCQLFFRWRAIERPRPRAQDDEDLICVFGHGELQLLIHPDFPPVPLLIVAGEAEIGQPREPGDEAVIEAYGAELVTPGVWAINPSLNIPGFIHGFVVLYDVPDPAPWERRIVLP